MIAPRTFTHTYTHTRTETIQEQINFLLLYARASTEAIEKVIRYVGVDPPVIRAVGIYGFDASGRRAEVELSVDWGKSAQLTLITPEVSRDQPGWVDGQATEINVFGSRFVDACRSEGLEISWWVSLTRYVHDDDSRYREYCRLIGLSATSKVPPWKTPPEERSYEVVGLEETKVTVRRAL